MNNMDKFNYIKSIKWLLPRLIEGIPTKHEDAIAAGLGHRLDSSVFWIRCRGFYGIIKTDFKNRNYYIPLKLRTKAKQLSHILGFNI